MCFTSKLSKSQKQIIQKLDADIDDYLKKHFVPGVFNAFEHPLTPVVCQPHHIEAAQWGLIPSWAKDTTIQNSTLNARIETLTEKNSFKVSVNNRCLILADGFFEWQWLDEKGRHKQKYQISLPDDELFTFAGLYSDWKNPLTRQTIRTYTLITTEANELMSHIHNSKKRMPVIVENQYDWLAGDNLKMANELLVAQKLFDKPTTGSLF
jgi:putative SOS response-associated peptidase YedK